MRLIFAVLAANLIMCAAISVGCGPLDGGSSTSATQRQTAGAGNVVAGGERPFVSPSLGPTLPTTVVRINEASERDAGRRREVEPAAAVTEWGADGGPMVSGDAGPRSAEIAWLVSHLHEGAESAGPAGPPNVRALAGYGADGARAVIALFRAGDARRVPHARTVIEMLARRACRGTADVMAPRRLVAWIETGSPTIAPPAEGAAAPSWPWQRGAELPWPSAGLDRMRSWADRGMFCVAPELSNVAALSAVDGGVALHDARAR